MSKPRFLSRIFVAAVAVLALGGFSLTQEGDPTLTEVWEPEPAIVIPGHTGAPPSDAIVLFDGTDLSAWQTRDGGAARWAVDEDEGTFTVVPDTGDIATTQGFGDAQLHIEWRTPAVGGCPSSC